MSDDSSITDKEVELQSLQESTKQNRIWAPVVCILIVTLILSVLIYNIRANTNDVIRANKRSDLLIECLQHNHSIDECQKL